MVGSSYQPVAALVLPTYNERENLPLLVAAIRGLPVAIQIIVVDDNSPDGTGALADELARQHPGVEVIHRAGKQGLGTAYAAGFARALATPIPLICTMDADFSHDPSYLPALVGGARTHDLTIGSRYVPGGGVVNWGVGRKLLSWGANTVAHAALGLHAAGLHRRLPLLSPPSARNHRPGVHPGKRLLIPDRDAVQCGTGRLHRRRNADHLCRPPSGPVEDLAKRNLPRDADRGAAEPAPLERKTHAMRNQGSSASLIELALIIVLIAIVIMAILLIMGDDLRLWIVNTIQGLFAGRS